MKLEIKECNTREGCVDLVNIEGEVKTGRDMACVDNYGLDLNEIVRIVNAHDGLVAALEDVLRTNPTGCSSDEYVGRDTVEKIKAAIKAEGTKI